MDASPALAEGDSERTPRKPPQAELDIGRSHVYQKSSVRQRLNLGDSQTGGSSATDDD
jgi:hypothetical protein